MVVMKKQLKKLASTYEIAATKESAGSETMKRESAPKEARKVLVKKEVPKPQKRSFKDTWENTKKYFRGVQAELKKVHWPNRREILVYTVVVLASVALVALAIWVVDSLLSQAVTAILPKK